MLVEDDPAVRRMIARMITRVGHEVIATGTVDEAQQLCVASSPRVTVLLTDVVMPTTRGPELAQELLSVRPDLDVLFMTGYDPAIADIDASPDRILKKPFGPKVLARGINAALTEAKTRPAD